MFAFAAPVSISRARIGFNRTQSGNIYLPSSVTIGGTAFSLTRHGVA